MIFHCIESNYKIIQHPTFFSHHSSLFLPLLKHTHTHTECILTHAYILLKTTQLCHFLVKNPPIVFPIKFHHILYKDLCTLPSGHLWPHFLVLSPSITLAVPLTHGYWLKVLVLLVYCTQVSSWLAFSSSVSFDSKYYLRLKEVWPDHPNIKVPSYLAHSFEPAFPFPCFIFLHSTQLQITVFSLLPFHKKRDLTLFISLLCQLLKQWLPDTQKIFVV